MGSAIAAAALGAFMTGAGPAASPAQAAIPPQDGVGAARPYRIPLGSVTEALNSIADDNELHILYNAAITRGRTTPGLSGDYTLPEALDRVLAGTGLGYRFTNNGRAVSIVLAQNDTVRSDAGAEALPTIDIGAPRPATGGPGSGKPTLTPENSYVTPVVSVGTKTDTTVMNTPVNVQAITRKAIEDQQAINFTEALRNVSGVYVTNATTSGGFARTGGIFLRGFQAGEFYRDGFRINRYSNIDTTGSRQLDNVSSIEVLKGPAAILYGVSEPGGIINITSNDPQEKPHYSITQQIGSLALYRTSVGATGPLTDDKSVLYRLSASYENNGAPFGSFVDLTHSQNVFVAPVVKWNLSETTSVKGEFEYNNDLTTIYRPNAVLFNGSFVTIPRNVNYWEGSPSHTQSIFAALSLSHRFDNDWSIKQRVAFDTMDYFSNFVNAGTSVAGGANPTVSRSLTVRSGEAPSTEATTFSTNFDIVGHFDLLGARNTMLIGGDFDRFSVLAKTDPQLTRSYATLISLAYPIHPGAISSGSAVSGGASSLFARQDTAGVYLQDQIELPYGFQVMAGARYQKIRQENTNRVLSTLGLASNSVTPSTDADRLTPRFGLLWRPQQWVSLYGNYTEGFGKNSGLVYPDSTLAPPSNAKSWEASAKFEFFDGRLRATADYYDLVKSNIPIADPDLTHVCAGLAGGCVTVVGAARSKGTEVDIQGELLPGWNVIVTYTNQDVRITNGTPSTGGALNGLQPGQRFPHVPRNMASLSTTYEFQDATFKGLQVGASYTYHGSQPINDRSGALPGVAPLVASWGTVDLMTGYSFDFDGVKTKAQVNVTNLFDRTYYADASVYSKTPSGFALVGARSYGPPFAVRGSLRFEF